jgi:hypothetical protein
MKQSFFTLLAIAIPVIILGGVVYMFLHGLYRMIMDWRLDRELHQLRIETVKRARQPARQDGASYDPLSVFDDRPPVPESPGIATLPLDTNWQPPIALQSTPDTAVGAVDEDRSHNQPMDPPVHEGELPLTEDQSDDDVAAPRAVSSTEQQSRDDWPNRTLD